MLAMPTHRFHFDLPLALLNISCLNSNKYVYITTETVKKGLYTYFPFRALLGWRCTFMCLSFIAT